VPTFTTPNPITVTIEIGVGDVRVMASDRSDTSVEILPTNPAKQSDVAAAEQTRVEYSDGRLLIKSPKGWRRYTPRGGGESIDVRVELPTGSQLRGDVGVAALHCAGSLGECRFGIGVGDIEVEQSGPARFSTGAGDILVHSVSGDAEIFTGAGAVRIGAVDGTAVIKSGNGDARIGDVVRDLRVVTANGSISVDRSRATVVAKTANGDVRLGEVERGTVAAQTSMGRVDIGIHRGVAAWLDLHTSFGRVLNELEDATRPQAGEPSVEIRARTSFGDITIRRAVASIAPAGAL
jgi:hypothetical protein